MPRFLLPKKDEYFSAYSHVVGLFFSIIGAIFLLIKTVNALENLGVIIIYCIVLCLLFAASALYHTIKRKEKEDSVWRKIDHIAIYYMIAGTYTPLVYIYLESPWKWIIIGLQWGFALVGTILKLFVTSLPRWPDAIIYLIMGWMIIIQIKQLFILLPMESFIVLFVGGLSYTIGAVFFAINKQKPFPGKFVFHDIFHVLIIIGAACHYFNIYVAV
ncbi:MAG: hemolysin III family protein [Candidatus Heimdallarchaeota archaeon]|nr:hemolysin III family protein [Candidatus Heimdallarchaeota archaeon]